MSLGHSEGTDLALPSGRDSVLSGCARVAPILARIGDKWTVLIMMLLGDEPLRFSEIKRSVDGISQRMLTLTLRNLERDGMVTRKVTPTIPPRVDYALTDLGRSLRRPLRELGGWVSAHLDQIEAAREAYDGRAD